MGMFDNATDEHVRGEHVDGDTSGVCPVCRRQSELADLYSVDDAPTCAACHGTVVASVYGGLVHADPADEMHHPVDLGDAS